MLWDVINSRFRTDTRLRLARVSHAAFVPAVAADERWKCTTLRPLREDGIQRGFLAGSCL